MGNRAFIIIVWIGIAGPSHAQNASPADDEERYQNVAAMGTPVGREQTTTLLLDQQTRKMQSGGNSLSSADEMREAKDRAAQMVEMLKTEEMQKALDKVTRKGKQALKENPSLQTPVGILAGAASLWFGRSLKIMTGELTVSTRIEGRARSSEFSMEHPLMNGKLRFSALEGIDINMNRTISSIESRAEFNYNIKNQSFSTSIRKRIAPNLDLSFGATQIPQTTITDGNARLEYHWDF